MLSLHVLSASLVGTLMKRRSLKHGEVAKALRRSHPLDVARRSSTCGFWMTKHETFDGFTHSLMGFSLFVLNREAHKLGGVGGSSIPSSLHVESFHGGVILRDDNSWISLL